MVFEENKKTFSYYQTPFGVLNMGISATDVRLYEGTDNIAFHVDYALDINDQYVADCEIAMNVKSRDGGNFHLGS